MGYDISVVLSFDSPSYADTGKLFMQLEIVFETARGHS